MGGGKGRIGGERKTKGEVASIGLFGFILGLFHTIEYISFASVLITHSINLKGAQSF